MRQPTHGEKPEAAGRDENRSDAARPSLSADAARLAASGGAAHLAPGAAAALQRSVGNAAFAAAVDRDAHTHGPGCGHTVQRAEDEEREEHAHSAGCGHGASVQRSATDNAAVQRSAVHDVLRSSGRPMDDATRTDMESRLGADFSDVRIHDNAAAKASAAEVGARAYTSGSHVVIGNGGNDKHTLAHELTHVIQQRQGPVAGTDNGSGLKVSDPSDRFEREAEANATRVMQRSATPEQGSVQRAATPRTPVPGAPAAVQRKVEYDDWSAKYLRDGGLAALFPEAAQGAGAPGYELPFTQMLRYLENAGREVFFKKDGKLSANERAKFVLEGGSGSIVVMQPEEGAGAQELRQFVGTLTHELQHAVDFVDKRLPTDKKGDAPQTGDQSKISTELRAFGREAAAALQAALGDTYAADGKLSQVIAAIPADKISDERRQLASEFQTVSSYTAGGHDPLLAFAPSAAPMKIGIRDSRLLERVAGYLTQYGITPGTASSQEALDWLRANPAVTRAGLIEGAELFKTYRPQKAG